ncbi:MAG: fumarylacetoacetase [Acidobacteria bacterium]|nr:fumarylacetoacetase [Acidobacteriota bacterium]
MPTKINETHDPDLKSWVESANDPETDFPIQNLPFALFARKGSGEMPRAGVAIGELILDLGGCHESGLLGGSLWHVGARCSLDQLNSLMEVGGETMLSLRRRISQMLNADCDEIRDDSHLRDSLLVPMSEAEFFEPGDIGDYTDFYASVYHATNIGKMFRPDNPLMPNYKWVPIGYHGRASSIVISGTPVRRPNGQTMDDHASSPVFGPSRILDYEMEVGFFVSKGNELGTPVKIDTAEDHIFGLCLVNDWSARDIQRWEYQPLGPFLAKNFATTISPWIVTTQSLAPYRIPAFPRPAGDPAPLEYLDCVANRERGGFDINLEVYILTHQMREQGLAPYRLSAGNTSHLYWTLAQMLTHHSSNGCDLRPCDLIASGTVSGPTKESQGSLIELTSRGSEPLHLPSGEHRKFIQDGDEVIMRGYCEREGFRKVGFGECRGIITPAIDY